MWRFELYPVYDIDGILTSVELYDPIDNECIVIGAEELPELIWRLQRVLDGSTD